ncbi:MAG: hypothetical protein WAT23_16420 [Chromatiaceae bacterium]
MRIPTGRMLLTPTDPLLAVDSTTLHADLKAIGFIGEPLPNPSSAFLVGKNFLSLLIFAGCSVNLALEPTPAGGPFTHVRLLGPLPRPALLQGRNTRPPRCRVCRALLRSWAQDLLINHETLELSCPACGSTRPSWEWDWRDQAGYGQSFITVEEVFPGEAEPTPTLLTALEAITASPWRHFYIQDSIT